MTSRLSVPPKVPGPVPRPSSVKHGQPCCPLPHTNAWGHERWLVATGRQLNAQCQEMGRRPAPRGSQGLTTLLLGNTGAVTTLATTFL